MKKVESEKETWRMIAECKAGLWQDEIPCGEEFEIGEEDLVVETVLVNMDCRMEVIGFKCPECGSYTELKSDCIPEVIRNRVLAKYYRKKKPLRGFKAWLSRVFG